MGFIFIAAMAMGQAKDEDVLRYIQKYKDIAIAEQIKYNIPASIKLAQGILESSGGKKRTGPSGRQPFWYQMQIFLDGRYLLLR
ncbi:MAG: glucosaminidase domain-containing protein [Taibaiella sp.]|nr:glucosaminidase domain-containing protein [Taibaiella sp.]